jgi:nucleoside phosphorylase
VHTHAFQIFRGETSAHEVRLCVTGIGKVRAAIATAHLLSNNGTSLAPSENPLTLNLGVCGAAERFSIGSLLIAQRVVDRGSGATWCPDNILSTPLETAELMTVERPVSRQTEPTSHLHLVDMEASGFAEAATLYTAPSAWAVLKIVADHFEPTSLSTERIHALIEPHAASIDEFCRSLVAAHRAETPTLSAADTALLSEFVGAYRFTASQRRMLMVAAREFCLRTGENLTCLRRLLHREPTSKNELKELFSEAYRALTEA